ncbi:hypothetical protein ASG43_08925 [Aureimonas sp. Leaf454]|uniref:hypothetical protein n=1 Tax=Aureimonas sp. Leaf454 TaxID=1736381 RepID=UPI00070110B7|nr:hypothetical protein [Aureimonas sp. Leaf454]KQT48946.1 hypothetical protein ASG43_08925 [Aureimonas sp. Leaf454]
MRVLYAHKLDETQRDGHVCLCTVDVELNEHVRLYALRLLRMRDGNHFLFAPNAGKRRTATFSPAMSARLTDLALAAYDAANDNGR